MSRANSSLGLVIACLAIAVLAAACGGGGGQQDELAFIRGGDIWIVAADGSGERPLGLEGVSSFSWLPTGELDVVISGPPVKHLLVSPDGLVQELQFPPWETPSEAQWVTLGAWSPDGAHYVYPAGNELLVVDRNGAEVARLEVGPPLQEAPAHDYPKRYFGRPVFSADGTKVLVASSTDVMAVGNTDFFIYEASLAQGASHALPAMVEPVFGFLPYDLSLSPDNNRLAFSRHMHITACEYDASLVVLDADGGNLRELVPADIRAAADGLMKRPPLANAQLLTLGYDWSPDGDALLVAFQMGDCGASFTNPPVVASGLYVVQADGSGERKVAELVCSRLRGSCRPSWAPSGDLAAYATEENDSTAIKIVDLQTGEIRDVGEGSAPAWRPAPR